MKIELPEEIKIVTKTVTDAGYEIYLVGGALRDAVLQKNIKDWDFATNAEPEKIQSLFEHAFYDNTFGTVGVPTENYGNVEITTFRSESAYSNKRHPDAVTWGKTIEEDLQRRDFTINAMALEVTGDEKQVTSDHIIDPYNGQEDLKNQVIQTVGSPIQRFSEDALRMLRAIRFACQLSFTIEDGTFQAIKANAELIQHVSGERIWLELYKILGSEFPYEGFMLLKNTGLLKQIIPELEAGFGVNQVGPNRHHIYDVGSHNFFALRETPATDPLVRFAALLHDIGKPNVLGKDSRGNPTFYNHEIVGANIARDIANRLHLSKAQRDKLVTLVRWHQFSVSEFQTDSAVRRFIRNVGVENIQDMIDVRIGDRLGSGISKDKEEGWRLREFRKRIEKELNPPFAIKDLVVDGNDVMKELNIQPGPQIGKVLQKLFEEVDEDLSKNNREYLLKRIHEVNE